MILKFEPELSPLPAEPVTSQMILRFKPLPPWKRRPRSQEYHLSRVHYFVKLLEQGEEGAHNNVMVELTALYYKCGKGLVNAVLDRYRLARFGFSRWDH
jgi:hypothetical protein